MLFIGGLMVAIAGQIKNVSLDHLQLQQSFCRKIKHKRFLKFNLYWYSSGGVRPASQNWSPGSSPCWIHSEHGCQTQYCREDSYWSIILSSFLHRCFFRFSFLHRCFLASCSQLPSSPCGSATPPARPWWWTWWWWWWWRWQRRQWWNVTSNLTTDSDTGGSRGWAGPRTQARVWVLLLKYSIPYMVIGQPTGKCYCLVSPMLQTLAAPEHWLEHLQTWSVLVFSLV